MQLERRRPLPSAEAETARPPPSVRPALTVGLRGDVLRRSKRPDVAPTAKEDATARHGLAIGPRQRAGAHIPQVRECPFPDMRPVEKPHWIGSRTARRGRFSGRLQRRRRDRTPGAAWVRVAAAVSITGVSAMRRSKYAGPDDAWNREEASACPAPPPVLALDDEQAPRESVTRFPRASDTSLTGCSDRPRGLSQHPDATGARPLIGARTFFTSSRSPSLACHAGGRGFESRRSRLTTALLIRGFQSSGHGPHLRPWPNSGLNALGGPIRGPHSLGAVGVQAACDPGLRAVEQRAVVALDHADVPITRASSNTVTHCAYARDATRPAKWRFRGSSPSGHLVGTALGRPHS